MKMLQASGRLVRAPGGDRCRDQGGEVTWVTASLEQKPLFPGQLVGNAGRRIAKLLDEGFEARFGKSTPAPAEETERFAVARAFQGGDARVEKVARGHAFASLGA